MIEIYRKEVAEIENLILNAFSKQLLKQDLCEVIDGMLNRAYQTGYDQHKKETLEHTSNLLETKDLDGIWLRE